VVELRGGGAPVKEGRQGLVGELRGEVGDRFRGLSRAEEGWGVEFHWSRRPAAVCTAAAAHRWLEGGGERLGRTSERPRSSLGIRLGARMSGGGAPRGGRGRRRHGRDGELAREQLGAGTALPCRGRGGE